MRTREIHLTAAVEGLVDEAVVHVLAKTLSLEVNAVHGKNGKGFLRQKLAAFNDAARHAPWVVLTDLDNDDTCAPPLRDRLMPQPAPQMCFRIAVRAVESWLLADRERVASFFAVPPTRVPSDPEAESNPKQTFVNLVRSSRRRAIREDMVPREGSGRSVGPAYVSRLIEFVTNPTAGWRCRIAARHADSLQRCIQCLERLKKAAASRRQRRDGSKK